MTKIEYPKADPLIKVTWVCENQLAHARWPRLRELDYLYNNVGIRAIVSLVEDDRPEAEKSILRGKGFQYHEERVEDGTAPTNEQFEQINLFIDKMRDEEMPVLVHCYAGGRSGTVLVAYLMHCSRAYSSALLKIQTTIPAAKMFMRPVQIKALKDYARRRGLLDV